MQVVNPERALQYLDAVQGERARGAVLAIHMAWLDHSSSLGRAERIESQTPLDMLILYEAAATTFQEGPAPASADGLPPGGRVMNRRQAGERLSSVADEEIRRLAGAFAAHVIALSSATSSEQDLDYYVALFLECVRDKRVIDAIMSGAISRSSDRLSDPDLW
jgi:hypothetical protein